mmetsp:Transcript_8055/g.19445  ORF Transcript_8055/g.19445 Transcript_8055/m.19445 type:complete len:216 (-) Transcript_8055:217-864(-)
MQAHTSMKDDMEIMLPSVSRKEKSPSERKWKTRYMSKMTVQYSLISFWYPVNRRFILSQSPTAAHTCPAKPCGASFGGCSVPIDILRTFLSAATRCLVSFYPKYFLSREFDRRNWGSASFGGFDLPQRRGRIYSWVGSCFFASIYSAGWPALYGSKEGGFALMFRKRRRRKAQRPTITGSISGSVFPSLSTRDNISPCFSLLLLNWAIVQETNPI